MSSPEITLRDEVVSLLNSATLSDGNSRVRRVFDHEQESEPSVADLPCIWVDALPGGADAEATPDTATGEVQLAVSCWVASVAPGKEGRRRASDLMSSVRRAIAANAGLGATLGVMPGAYRWGGGLYAYGEKSAMQSAVLTLPINCGIDLV